MPQPNLSGILQFWWLVPLLLSILGLFFSLWIVVPAPNYFLLPLGVATPEISPWLICLNLLALILILSTQLRATGNQAIFLEIPWTEHSFDAVFPGISNQLALYYTERFLASLLHGAISNPVELDS